MSTSDTRTARQPGPPAELDLYDLARALWRYRLPWLLTVLAGVGVAVGVGTLVTPEYESEAVVQVGLLGPGLPVEQPGDVLAVLRARHGVWRRDRDWPRIERVEFLDQRVAPSALRIVAVGLDPASAQRLARAAADQVVAEHSPAHARRIADLERLAGELGAVVDGLGDQRRRMAGAVQPKAGELPLWATLAAEAGAQESVAGAVGTLASVRMQLEVARRSPTRVIFEADLPDRPARPSRRLLALVGLLLGGLAATLVVIGLAARSATAPTGDADP